MRSQAQWLLMSLMLLTSLVDSNKLFTAERVIRKNESGTRQLQTLTKINKAKVGSKTFTLVDHYDCDNKMLVTVRRFFKVNSVLFDKCVAETGYKLYPFTGIIPNESILSGLLKSSACMGIITAVVLVRMPPCLLDELGMRAACETILYYSEAMKHGIKIPTSTQFEELMTWRRDVNLAKAAGKPYDGKSIMYSEFTKYMGKAVANTNVSVTETLTVLINDQVVEANDSIKPLITTSFDNYIVGRVSAAKNESSDSLNATAYKTGVNLKSSDGAALSIALTTFVTLLFVTVLVI